VNTGEVVAKREAAAGSQGYVIGDAVNVAARFEQAAEPGEVLVGARSARASRRARLEPARRTAAKGFPEPLAAARAIAVDEPYRRPAPTPFVGRADDLELLQIAYRRAARARVPELVTITGEAGVGKTRLATELTDALRCEDPEPRVLVGRNPPYGRGIAFWALAEILRGAAGARADEPPDAVRVALARELAAAERKRLLEELPAPVARRLALKGLRVDPGAARELAHHLDEGVGARRRGGAGGYAATRLAADGGRPRLAAAADRRRRRCPLGGRELPRPARADRLPAR
jgi:hypothetical protein